MGRRTLSRGGAAAIIGVALALLVGSVAEANLGDLDTTFGSGGKQTLNLGGTDRATHVVVMPDGRLVVVGSTDATDAGHNDFAIARFTASGAPDTSFNSTGHVTLGTHGVDDVGGGVVVQADGRIVVSGFGGTSQDFITRRLNANGTVDGTFAGGTGTSDIDFGGADVMTAMVAQSDGKLVLVGSTPGAGGAHNFAIARLNADGTVDGTFGVGGKLTVSFGGDDAANAVAIQPDGRIVVAGQGGPGQDMAVVRLTSTGALDSSFGSGGRAFVDFGGTEAANGVALQPDGRVVLAGTTSAQGAGDFAVARLTTAGAIDTTFHGSGKYAFGFGAASEQGLALALQQNGRIVVMGTADVNNDFVVARLDANGNPDTSFGTGGSVGVDFGGFEFDGDVAIQPDGQIVIAGSTNVHDGGDFALARLQGDPVTPPPTTTTTTTTTTGAPGLPVPRFRVGTSLKLPGGTRFSGFDSTVAAGRRIINYHWQIELPKRKTFQTDCGSQSALSLSMRLPTLVTAKLIVTDSSGAQASTQQRFRPVKKLGVKPTGAFDCENPAKGNQASTADCAKSFGTGFLDINSRGGPTDCFEIANVNPPSGAPYTTATVAGPVAINGLYVPVPKTVKTDYDSQNRVALHDLSHIELKFGTFVTKDIDLHFQATPKQGVYHLVDVNPEVNTPKFLGSLPISGSFSIDLIAHASRVHIGVGLPSPFSFGAKKTAQAKLYLYSDNRRGLRYDGISATVPSLWLGPLYVENLHFAYEKSSNSWEGAAKVTLPGSRIALNAAPPPPDFGFKLAKGKFASAGFGIHFQPPTQPDLFPPFHTALLSHIGGAVGLNPFRITGTIGISAANIVDEDGVLLAVFATGRQPYTLPEDPGPELAPLAGRTFGRFSLAIGGTASVKVPILGGLPLLHAYGLYEFPDYFEFGGGFSFKVGIVSLDGSVSGFVYPSSRKFNAEANLQACLKKVKIGKGFFSVTISPCLGVGAVVSSRGIGFCGTVRVPLGPVAIPVQIGAGYRWGDSAPQLMLFKCDFSGYRERSPFAARDAATGYRVMLPRGLPAEMFRVRGTGGTPSLVITDPHGQDITKSGDAITVEDTEPNTVLVGLRHPAAGTWTITAAAGSVPIADVASADGLPDPGITARVTGVGRRRVLHYRYTPVTGRKVTFVERGRDASRVLGNARGRSGTIAFTPGPGRGKHMVIAQLSQDGTPMRDLRVATFTAPGPVALTRPAHVRAARRRGTIRVSWRAVAGARLYEVLVQLADGSREFRVVSRPHVTIPDPLPSRRGSVSVDALSIDSVRGRATTVRLAPVRARRR
jgi:uncharacterized delta-60 repeat protein